MTMDKQFLRIIQGIGLAVWLFALLWAYKAGLFSSFGSLGFLVLIGLLLIGWLIIAWGLQRILP